MSLPAPSASAAGTGPTPHGGSARVVSGRWVLPGRPDAPGAPAAAIRDGAIALDEGRVLAVGPRAEIEARFGRGEQLDAVILPAFVNAHVHLELSHLRGCVPGGAGLAAWIARVMEERAAHRADDVGTAMDAAAQELRAAGVAAVGEVTNTLASLPPLARAGLCGAVFHEVLGFTRERFASYREAARAERGVRPAPRGLRVYESPHAVYSTHREGLRELLLAGPGSIHLAEDPAERPFCAEGTGPFRQLLAGLGVGAGEIESLRVRGRTPVAAAVQDLGLGAGRLAVHCVSLDGGRDLNLLAACGATAVLCPRSNRHITGLLPPLRSLLSAGVPLAIGTDSLASSPSLAPLADLALLRREFPEVHAAHLLPLAWNGPAVFAPHVGRLAIGESPGVLAAPLGGMRPEDPFEFVLGAFGAGDAPPFRWIAPNGLEARA